MKKRYFLILILGCIVLSLSPSLLVGKPEGVQNVLLYAGNPSSGSRADSSPTQVQRSNTDQISDTVFIANFSVGEGNEIPFNWKVERHTNYLKGSVMGSSYFRLLSSGNRFLPLSPKMSGYTVDLELDFACVGKNNNIFRLFYRYDPEGQRGEFIDILIEDRNHFKVLKGVLDGKTFSSRQEILSGEFSGRKAQLAVQTDSKQTRVTLNGQSSPYFDTYYSAPSTVALEHGESPMQEVHLLRFNLCSSENIEESEILSPVKIVFPWGINGMDIPISYTVSVIERGGLSVIRVKLAGSVLEQQKSPWFPYHVRKIDWLTSPYIRLMGKRYDLSDTTLLLSAHQNDYFYQIFKKPTWPLKCEFILESQLPKQFLMVFGYDHYCNESEQDAAGGPSEVIVDMPSGKILHQGKALIGRQENQFDIQIESPSEKKNNFTTTER